MRYIRVAVVFLAVVIAFAILTFVTVDYGSTTRSNQALLQAQNIAKAIRAYHDRTEGSYPESLDQLVTQSDSRPPLMEGGEYAVIDPWGKRFNFEVVTDEKGNERVVVWTTDNQGERIQRPRK